jgi:hypothetical protein
MHLEGLVRELRARLTKHVVIVPPRVLDHGTRFYLITEFRWSR